jgi:hypothetical protein
MLWLWFVLAFLLVLAAVAVWFIGSARNRPAETSFRVDTDDNGIMVTMPSGARATLRWVDLTRVTIRTTDEGPMATDVFWEFHTATRSPAFAVPGGATGESDLVSVLGRRLPGFRHDEVVRAMASTTNDLFLIWEAADAGSARRAAR